MCGVGKEGGPPQERERHRAGRWWLEGAQTQGQCFPPAGSPQWEAGRSVWWPLWDRQSTWGLRQDPGCGEGQMGFPVGHLLPGTSVHPARHLWATSLHGKDPSSASSGVDSPRTPADPWIGVQESVGPRRPRWGSWHQVPSGGEDEQGPQEGDSCSSAPPCPAGN